MTLSTALALLTDVHADLAELIGELCWLASAADALGDSQRRDEVIELAGELAEERRAVGVAGAH
jgi:hypothetical protein